LQIYALNMKNLAPHIVNHEVCAIFLDEMTLTNRVVHSDSFHWAQFFLVTFFFL
jgi:hypothetical protein